MTFPILGPTDRRAFLGSLATGAAFFTTRGLFAEELARTPSRTEGPFYPDKLPLDQDNDLIILSDSLTPAVGDDDAARQRQGGDGGEQGFLHDDDPERRSSG